MSKRNGKQRYKDRLIPSTQDDVMLCDAVTSRFLTLNEAYLRIRGQELPIPDSLNLDMFRWREMAVRYKGGDMRHRESELKSLKTIAQWTVDVNGELRNQESKTVDWKG